MIRISLLSLSLALMSASCIVVSQPDQDDRLDEYDVDGDSFYSTEVGGEDCDDEDASVNPAAEEVCDGIDNDCTGGVDESLTTIEFPDADADGYGDSNAPTIVCPRTDGYTALSGDCDDTNAASYPGADELCDNKDNDCDGEADEALEDAVWFQDLDGDGYGDPDAPSPSCGQEDGYVNNAEDCDDTDFTVNPAESDDACNLVDDNCDGTIDETDGDTVYPDDDGDGQGDPNRPTAACDAPSDWGTNNDDCNDSDASIYLGAVELCDELDNDCNSTVDDGAPDDFTYYPDADGDGFADAAGTAVDACTPPTDHVLIGWCTPDATLLTQGTCEAIEANTWEMNVDCDDALIQVNPSVMEVCDDGLDNDCSGAEDDLGSGEDGRDDTCP